MRHTERKPLLLQPQLPYRNLDHIVKSVSAQHFKNAYDDVTWSFVIQRTLANIMPAARHVQIHNVLNATDVPEDVFVTIIIHEMLHLEIPAVKDKKGKWNSHPDEFWEAERNRSPNREASWDWLYTNLPLERRERLQCTDVVGKLIRFSPEERAAARVRFGIELPARIRSDDPLFRRISFDKWYLAIAETRRKNSSG
ncbi:hypothetical protein IMX07_14740 [bacterium]|nr:hypothetical protein [bacterium]